MEKTVHDNNMTLYTFNQFNKYPWLGHGFTTRNGGVSAPPFHSLNLGKNTSDTEEALKKNYRRLIRVENAENFRFFLTNQVHGDTTVSYTHLIFLIEGFNVKSFNIGEQIKVKDFYVLQHAIELIHLLEKSHIEAKPILKYVNGSIELELNTAYKVKFGDGTNIERKFNNFVDIYDDLNSKQAISGVIDVSNEGLPSYRPFGE